MTLPIFPTLPGLSWPVKRVPTFKSNVQEGLSGRRSGQRYQLEPRWAYDIPIEFARDFSGLTEFRELVSVYLACYGAFGTFLFNDRQDNAVTAQLIGFGDGTTQRFFLARTAFGFAQRIAGAALNGIPTLSVGGLAQSPSAFSIDNYGMITFTGAPASGAAVTWTGAFYWICRFADDQLDLTQFMNNWWEVRSLKFATELIIS
jgi:uncharacterized protein (TIGR02217 family)